jgi:hypothetical protein
MTSGAEVQPMPTKTGDNIQTVSDHYDRLFDLVNRARTYQWEGVR